MPIGFVQNHYSFSATYTSLLNHGETLVVFAVLLFISILSRLGSYPLPIDMLREHLAVTASCVLCCARLFLWHIGANRCKEASHDLLQGYSDARDQFLALFSGLCPSLLVRDSVVKKSIADK